ncbi:MAG: TIM barrel protein [Nitrososphaerales archaeon]|jgi:deoxyribonuclease-4
MSREPLIGLHISIEKSLDLAFDRAQEIGCTTFQIFTRNPRTWRFKPLQEDQAEAFRDKRKKSGFKFLVAHMPYLPNLASSDKATMKASRLSLNEEVRRCDSLGIDYLVTHLGSHLGSGTIVGVKNVSVDVYLSVGY